MKSSYVRTLAAMFIGFGLQASVLAQQSDEKHSDASQSKDSANRMAEAEVAPPTAKEFDPSGYTILVKDFPGSEVLSNKRIVLEKDGVIAGDFFKPFSDNGALLVLPKWQVEGRRVIVTYTLQMDGEKRVCRTEVSIRGMQAGKSKARFLVDGLGDNSAEIADIAVSPTKKGDATPVQIARPSRSDFEVSEADIRRFNQIQAMNRQRQLQEQRNRYQMQYENLRRRAEMEAQEEADRAVRDFRYKLFP